MFNEENYLEFAQRPSSAITLTAFFNLCRREKFAQILKYHEVPEYYTCVDRKKIWNRRKQGEPIHGENSVVKVAAIGRVYSINSRQCDVYFVRVFFLIEVGEPTSFWELQRVNSKNCPIVTPVLQEVSWRMITIFHFPRKRYNCPGTTQS